MTIETSTVLSPKYRKATAEASSGGFLFLLDEILHGTNARDRREATA